MLSAEQAMARVRAQNPEAHLVTHAAASGAVMAALARHLGRDAEDWALAGLLHDLDSPLTMDSPERHGALSAELLAGDLPEEMLYAIRAHNSEHTGTEPASDLDYALRCCETVTGLINAAALVRPEGFTGMKVSSLKKKMKDKSFAASVSRERIRECEKLGVSLDDFLALAVSAMQELDGKA